MPSTEPTVEHLPQGGFPELLRDLRRRRATGRLDLVALGDRRQLWFDGGSVQAVASDAEDEKLGAWLVAQGWLEPARMALSLLRQPDGVRYGTFLVREGLIAQDRLADALSRLAVTIVAKLLAPAATYMFVAGEALPEDASMLDTTVADLLVAAVRQGEDAAGIEELIPAESFPSRAETPPEDEAPAQLSPQEGFLLARIDGALTVAQLRRVVPLARDDMTRCLASLVAAGLVNLRKGTGGAPGGGARIEVAAAGATQEPAGAEKQLSDDQRREFDEVARLAVECRERDYYRRLGLAHGATLHQVHERYRDYVRMYHPDRAREPHLRSLRRELGEIHAAIGEAYDTLVNPELRTRYNDSLRNNTALSPEEKVQDDRRQRARRELARANVQRAQSLVRAGDFGAAVQLLDEAVRAEPTAESLLMLARLEQRNPMWNNRVLDHLRAAVTIDPQLTDGWLELASFWGKKGQKERQQQSLEKIIAYDPLNPEAVRTLAALRGKK